MDLYFAGAEQPIYLRHLISLGVTHVAISYYEWQNRHSQDDIYKHVPAEINVCITAGVARKEAIDWDSFSKDYVEFCEANSDRCLIYDMDAPEAPEAIRRTTRSMLSMFPNTVLFPLEGESLEVVAYDNERVGINSRIAKSVPTNELRRLQASLYGSNVTDPKVLRPAKFTATTSLAWLSARRYGELWIFARGRLHYYSAEKRLQAVRAHASDIEALGIDPHACLSETDKTALTEVAVKSLQIMANDLSTRPRDRSGVHTTATQGDSDTTDQVNSTAIVPVGRDRIFDPAVAEDRERILLPVIALKTESGITKVGSVPDSIRSCNSCYINNVCPSFKVDAACAYTFPVEFNTDDQWEAAIKTILEIQFGRIAFANMAEQLDGGGLTPRLGQEMDRFMKQLKDLKDLKAPVPTSDEGALSRIFGVMTPPNTEVESDASQAAFEIEEDEDEYEDAETVE